MSKLYVRPKAAAPKAAPAGVTIAHLVPGMCRWPIGEPTSSDFRYCGEHAGEGRVYCAQHLALAFQPQRKR